MKTRRTILVVDNEFDQLKMMEALLQRIGFDVLITDDPRKALAWIRSQAVDAVVLDLIMPAVDGTELCEQIKRLRPDVRVYAYSGHIHLYRPKQLRRAGFDGIIGKPATLEEIDAALNPSAAPRTIGTH